MTATERVTEPSASIPRTLGDRLEKARKMAGLTYIQLNERTGMARNSMPKYEKDLIPVRAHTIMTYAMATHTAFGLEPYQVFDWLVHGDTTCDLPADVASDLAVSDSRCNVSTAPVFDLALRLRATG